MEHNKIPSTEEKQEDTSMEEEEEESSDDDDDEWDCAHAEIKGFLDYLISRVWEDNRDTVTRDRFIFILQVLLNDPEFLMS